MDIFLSAVASDLISRLLSSLIAKYQMQVTKDKLIKLQRLLLRARTIVEEAEGRHIANQGMLMQLWKLMDNMYRGYYVLDSFLVQGPHPNRLFAVSQSFNSPVCADGTNDFQSVLERLETVMDDMKEFIVFLCDYPRLPRQPYNTYIFMDNCMFGRYIEKEQIINFLLQPCLPNDSTPSVLPIIGPHDVGKKTLVEHACKDETVRKHFARIVHLNSNDLHKLRNDCIIEHQNFISDEKLLIVVQLDSDSDSVAWTRIYSSICFTNISSRIILISTRKQDSSLGTVQALKLKTLRQEEYMYFFKVLAFGSANPEEHPELLSIAMKLVENFRCSFLSANIISRLLRDNLNVQFWNRVLKVAEDVINMHFVLFGKHPHDLYRKSSPSYIRTFPKNGTLILRFNLYKFGHSTQKELPRITIYDILIGNVISSEEKIDVLIWKSPIPPYYCYIANCFTEKSQLIAPEEKCLKRQRVVQ